MSSKFSSKTLQHNMSTIHFIYNTITIIANSIIVKVVI